MSTNLLDTLKGYITPDLISQASNMLGESEGGISKAVSTSLPTLLGGLLHQSSNSSIMGTVMDLVTKSSSDSGGILSNLTGLLSNNTTGNQHGTSLLNTLFGSKLAGVTDMIASSSGIKSTSAASILGMAAPLVLGHLGKTGTSLSGLTSMLSSQKDSILSAVPAGLSSLGFGNISSTISNAASNVSTNTEKAGGLPKWLLPLLLIIAALAALYFFTKGCKKEVPAMENKMTTATDSLITNTMDSVATGMDSLASKTTNVVTDAANKLGDFFKFKLPNGIELNAPKNGIENQVVTWMNDKTKLVDKTTWFNFDRLLFETGKSTLKPESQEQLKNVAEIMKAFPTMEIKLGGYTDNTGNPTSNLKLSDERAKSVMNELVKLGIAANRITAEGYGDKYPVASNDTAEGRNQNRRIAIRITKK